MTMNRGMMESELSRQSPVTVESMPSEYERLVVVRALLEELSRLNERHALFAPGAVVLDLGCGEGQTVEYIASLGCDVDGVDLNESSIQKARKHYPSLHFEAADATELHTEKRYDTIVSQMVVCNLENEALVRKFITNAYRSLKDGGTFFLSNTDAHESSEEGDLTRHAFEASLETGSKMKVQLLNESGGYSEAWTNYNYFEEDLVGWLEERGFQDIVVDDAMRDNGYYFIIAKKYEHNEEEA